MRLSSIVCHIRRKIIPGNRFTGKHRVRIDPNSKQLGSLRQDFAREDQNMFYLRKPYFTVEQDALYQSIFPSNEDTIQKSKEIQKKINIWLKDYPHRTMEEMLLHLSKSEKWF